MREPSQAFAAEYRAMTLRSIMHGAIIDCSMPGCGQRFVTYSLRALARAQAKDQKWERPLRRDLIVDEHSHPRTRADACPTHAATAKENHDKRIAERAERKAKRAEQKARRRQRAMQPAIDPPGDSQCPSAADESDATAHAPSVPVGVSSSSQTVESCGTSSVLDPSSASRRDTHAGSDQSAREAEPVCSTSCPEIAGTDKIAVQLEPRKEGDNLSNGLPVIKIATSETPRMPRARKNADAPTMLDVIAQIMAEHPLRALSAHDVVALASGRLPTNSKTPHTVVSRDLALDVKRHGIADYVSRFERVAAGRFQLRRRNDE